MRFGLAVLAASSGLTLPLAVFVFLWMWYVGVIVLTFSPKRALVEASSGERWATGL